MPAYPAQEKERNYQSVASLASMGLTSRQKIKVDVELAPTGQGITFHVLNAKTGAFVEMTGKVDSVVNTLRNVVLGSEGVRLCIVEHFLAAASLWGFEDLNVRVEGPEMPLGDGSAELWVNEFARCGIERKTPAAIIELPQPIVVSKQDRLLMAVPDQTFSVSYMMDWNHPLIGKRWQSWDPSKDISEITTARTFGWLKEHQLLGLEKDVVSLTPDGFTQPLRFEDEPVRHKLLDLVGDLALAGVNPLKLKARFISIKGGHELDVEMAKKLAPLVDAFRSGSAKSQ